MRRGGVPEGTLKPPRRPLPAAPWSRRSSVASSSGRLLLRAAGLTLRLEAPLDLPFGARLELLLPHDLKSPPPGPAAPPAGDDPLRRVIEALLRRHAAAEGEHGALRLPAADHALAARLLRWVQALGASAPSAAAAPAEGSDPAGADGPLRGALGELGRLAREPQAGGWRVLLMPLGAEDPGPLKLYLRDLPLDPERAPRPGRDRRSATARAIFEVELSRLGRCQLDVLCQAVRFELVVRSERPLPAALEDDIRVLVQAASEVAGWAGKVEFRAAALLPLPTPRAAQRRQITA